MYVGGCREHFVSGCWHSSGPDRGRYPKECWLSTLGVLHPGVLVMWYGHIRDLSPTAEDCMGGRLPNVSLHWAKQPRWCKAVMIGWMGVGWEGYPPHIIAHTTRVAHAQVEYFLSPVALQLARCSLQPGLLPWEWLASLRPTLSGMPSVRGMRASPRTLNSRGILPPASAVRECSGNVVGVHAVSLEIMQIVTSTISAIYG